MAGETATTASEAWTKPIAGLLASPEWWFTVVVAGLVIRVVAAFGKDWISSALSSVSKRYKAYSERRLDSRARRIILLAQAPRLLIVEYVRCALFLLVSAMSSGIAIILPLVHGIDKHFPELDFFALPPATTERLTVAAGVVSIATAILGAFLWFRVLTNFITCEYARRLILRDERKKVGNVLKRYPLPHPTDPSSC